MIHNVAIAIIIKWLLYSFRMSIIHIHDSDNKRVKLEMDIKELECPVCYNIPREFPIPACPAGHVVCKTCRVKVSASKSSIRRFVITEKAPTRAFSWLKAATTAFTFKTLC